MSYQKITATDPNTIRFYYAQDTIFDHVSLLSMQRAKRIIDEKTGEDQTDEYGITLDERDLFKKLLDNAATQIFLLIRKMVNSVDPAFDSDEGESTSDDTTDDYIEFWIRDNDAYNEADLELVDKLVQECLIMYTLFDWYTIIGLTEEAQKYLSRYNNTKKDLVTKALYKLKIRNIS